MFINKTKRTDAFINKRYELAPVFFSISVFFLVFSCLLRFLCFLLYLLVCCVYSYLSGLYRPWMLLLSFWVNFSQIKRVLCSPILWPIYKKDPPPARTRTYLYNPDYKSLRTPCSHSICHNLLSRNINLSMQRYFVPSLCLFPSRPIFINQLVTTN